jgi:type I restriction-modification system DNA methylase subunit
MASLERQQVILNLLKNLRGADSLKRLFSELNYKYVNKPLSKHQLSEASQIEIGGDPTLLATAGQDDDFGVIYVRLDSDGLLRTVQRPIIQKLLQNHPYSLFVFSNKNEDLWHFVNVKYDPKATRRKLFRRITVGKNERLRTASQRVALLDVDSIQPDLFGLSPLEVQTRHDEAFDVHPVTRDFYHDYKMVFDRVEVIVEGFDDKSKDMDRAKKEKERKRLFTQRLFNRLMFIGFIQKKGWLKFNESADYLVALWKDHQGDKTEKKNFYRDRLKPLFFHALSTSTEVNIIGSNRGGFLKTLVGDVPYLNGGLFEEATEDRDTNITVPDAAADLIINDLFEKYNFTVTESTPLDQEVAIDPEMLGKVFEELVTGRNETGSYYTPKPIVSFMCRESLKGYLGSQYASLVDEHDTSNITVPEARTLLSRLGKVLAIDPACGSGAYLLGMLHELHDLTRLLDTRARQQTARDDYERKLQIITNNLYGVDKDEFAVQIARLRLWLSLAVEYEGFEPEPLPNLDFKIECGDSLSAPSPTQMKGQVVLREAIVREYQKAKANYLKAHHGAKKTLRGEVNKYKDELSRMRGTEKISGFDWAVEFAEVFAGRNGDDVGGFDIVLANPPYGATVDDAVRTLYFDRTTEGPQSKDTYGLFLARGLQLLCLGGHLCYIVSDTWRTIKTHKPLRKRLADTMTVKHVLDLPGWIFDATVNTCILTVTKRQADDEHQLILGDLRGIPNADWDTLQKNLRAVAEHGIDVQTTEYARYTYPQSLIPTYDNYSFFIASPQLYKLMSDPHFTKLNNIASVKVGLQTSDNNYYLRKRTHARGAYGILDEDELLDESEIEDLTDDEKVSGIDPKTHNGKYFLPYDKGGESEAGEGWMPNYYVPTAYFIDWSKRSVKRLLTHTSDRQAGRIAARFQNREYYFRQGITFSPTGIYSPTFRVGSGAIFGNKGSTIFSDDLNSTVLLGILTSKVARYLLKNYLSHTVETGEEVLLNLVLPQLSTEAQEAIRNLVSAIIKKQKADQRYPYHLHEQREIDELVYQLYDLSEEVIREIEIWYCRRYPRLAEAQGVIAEVKAKYCDHLARCERILEKPPAYWRSNPILTLTAQDESSRLEFKETLEADNKTGAKFPSLVTDVLRTVAGFLNAEGGTLLIGVADSGEIKGLQKDLDLLGKANANLDKFQLKLRSLLRDRLDPDPLGRTIIRFGHLPEGVVCRVDVEPQREITHLDGKEVHVRVGNRTEKLEGPTLAKWIQERAAR